jgi:diguanylate cyclase (GGDEF)-like protein
MRKQGTLENVQVSLMSSDIAHGERYWIYLSYISNDVIKGLTFKRLIIASATYLLLFFVTAVVSFFFARNIVHKKLAYRQLQLFAMTDALTGLANRRELEKVAEREFQRAQRFERDISLMMIDLDHFKDVNDTFDHSIGDKVLRHVAGICNSVIRGQDILARYGGEEFTVMLPETDLEGARELAIRICRQVSDTAYETEQMRIPVSVSIGVASISESDNSYHEILLRADQALHQAKRDGRNQVVVFNAARSKEPPSRAATVKTASK